MTDSNYCSMACCLYRETGHDPDCWPIEPPTEAEREVTREAYKQARAGLKQSRAKYGGEKQ